MGSTRLVKVIDVWLASNDSRDKLMKGAGCFFKLLGLISSQEKYLKVSAAMSDCRCLMRLLSWINNTKKVSDALGKNEVGFREVLFLLRVIFDGIFCLLDNVVYMGHFFNKVDPNLIRFRVISRASLFWGYVAAVILDLHDLIKDKAIQNSTQRHLGLFRNACDMISTLGGVCCLDIGPFSAAFLGLLSATISTNEQIQAAKISMGPQLGGKKLLNHR
ncbi:unnamed protein product [Phytomonas sp. Hart1]|nr:unnamed protein product [Phytomonas sp. Hart1]|eukprot:CCW66097.1 unnamed protein product [Phytomonas sp. isolate Hart1]